MGSEEEEDALSELEVVNVPEAGEHGDVLLSLSHRRQVFGAALAQSQVERAYLESASRFQWMAAMQEQAPPRVYS